MKHLDLFSGIGGFALACQWNGIETIGFVEIDKYCQKVLRKHWPNVPIVEDIRDVETVKEIVANTAGEGCLPKRHEVGITSQAIQETPTRESSRTSSISGITERGRGDSSKPAILITAGFPCQPFSVAGKRQGEEDDRYLWPETLAVIKAVQPSWILLENVTGIINLALDIVLSDLEGASYAYETLIIPACAVNAWHRRDRVWIVAHSNESGLEGGEARLQSGLGHRLERCNQDVAESSSNGLEGQKPVCEVRQSSSSIGCSSEDWWAVEPELGRVAHGIPHRVDRLKCLGNAIVPQVAYEIIKVIMTGERNG